MQQNNTKWAKLIILTHIVSKYTISQNYYIETLVRYGTLWTHKKTQFAQTKSNLFQIHCEAHIYICTKYYTNTINALPSLNRPRYASSYN